MRALAWGSTDDYLNIQAAKTLAERCAALNAFHPEALLKKHQLARHYVRHGIKKKVVQWTKGDRIRGYREQNIWYLKTQRDLILAAKKDQKTINVDECHFSFQTLQKAAYSRKCQHITVDLHRTKVAPLIVFFGISVTDGLE